MSVDSKRSLLEAFRQTLTDESAKDLVQAYAKGFDYQDLERVFLEQLLRETPGEDET